MINLRREKRIEDRIYSLFRAGLSDRFKTRNGCRPPESLTG